MCLPLGFLKCYTILGAISTLILGLALTGITIFGFAHDDIWIADSKKTKYGVMIPLLLLDLLIVLTSILAIYGIKKQKPLLIFMFSVMVWFFFLTSLTLGIIARVGPDVYVPSNCAQANSTWYHDTKVLYNNSHMLCQNECPCDFKNLDKYTELEQDTIRTAYPALNGTLLNLQGCSVFKDAVKPLGSPDILSNLDHLGAIEQYLNCTGWCQNDPSGNLLFFKFSSVNDGRAKDFCYPRLRTEILYWSNVVGDSCFINSSIFFLICLFNFCICCHPDRRKVKITERFHHEPEGSTGYIQHNDS